MNDINTAAVMKWFSGRAAEKAAVALKDLADSITEGCWKPGVSRSCRAALSKHNVATKLARKHYDALHGRGEGGFGLTRENWYQDDNRHISSSAFNLYMALQHSHHGGLIQFDALRAAAQNNGERELVVKGEEFVKDMTPAWEAMRELDNARPKPTFTFLGVSPTVTKTLLDAGLDLNLDTIRVCPMEARKVEENGKVRYVYVLLWPAGTVHHASRFARGNCLSNCHACGHAIKNAFNWIPMLVDGKNGKTYSLWVGRDCAKSIFGIDMKGDLEIDAEQGA